MKILVFLIPLSFVVASAIIFLQENGSGGQSPQSSGQNSVAKEQNPGTDEERELPTVRDENGTILIQLTEPVPNGVVTSPLTVKGMARGYWFFEASFPLVLVNWDGLIIAQHYATAQDDWMTEELIPFEGTIEFEKPDVFADFAKRGALILQKDNPSGLPENDNALEITVFFE